MIRVTEKAAEKLRELLAETNKKYLRIGARGGGCSGLEYALLPEDESGPHDLEFESNGVKLIVDHISIRYLEGAEIDFVESLTGDKFAINNPNATSTCGCGQSFTVDKKPDKGGET